MNQHQQHRQRPTFHNVLIHSHKWPGKMSPFYLTAEQQYSRYGQTDPEIVTKFSLHIHKFILNTCILIETVHDFGINIHISIFNQFGMAVRPFKWFMIHNQMIK